LAKTIRRQTARLAYSIERLAKESDISRSMIYEEIAAGRLIARKIGRRTIVRRSDALRWLRSLPPLDSNASNGGSIEEASPAS
jgi:Helix-turn-helix domain